MAHAAIMGSALRRLALLVVASSAVATTPAQAQSLLGTDVSVSRNTLGIGDCTETVIDPGIEFVGLTSHMCDDPGGLVLTPRFDIDLWSSGFRLDVLAEQDIGWGMTPVVEEAWMHLLHLNPICPSGHTGTVTGITSVSTNIDPLEWDPSMVRFTDDSVSLVGDPMLLGGDVNMHLLVGDFIEVEVQLDCPASVGELLLHNYGGEDSGEIGVLDPYSGGFSPLAVLQGITADPPFADYELTYVVDTAAAPDGTVYASTQDWVVGAPSGYFSRLWKLDLVNPLDSEFIGYIGSTADGPYYAQGLAFGPDGKLYGAGYNQLTYEATIFELDTVPYVNPTDPYLIPYATPTPLIEYGFTDYPGDIAFTCDGTMYMTTLWHGAGPLIEVDLDALTMNYLPTISAGSDFDGLAYDPSLDVLYGITSDSEVYSIDRTSSVATYLSDSALTGALYGIAGATWSFGPSDTDLDGTCDVVDLCPAGPDHLDADSDGVPDACDLPVLSMTGTCPGPADLDLTNVTAWASAGFFLGTGLGTTVIPSGSCAGTELGITGVSVVGTMPDLDGDGEFHLTPVIPPSACGRYLQVLDRATCVVTNVVAL